MLRLTLLITFIVSILTACTSTTNSPTDTNNTAISSSLVFEQKNVSRQEGKCTGDEPCIKASIVYPQAIGNSDAIKKINAAIEKSAASFLSMGETLPINVTKGIADFFTSYNDFKKDMPDAPQAWEVDTKGEVVYQTPQKVGVMINGYAYMGGAHPNSYLTYLNFDAQTGNQLKFADIISDTIAFKQLVEKKFREINKLAPNASLEEAGFMFPDNKFILPANIGLSNDSLLLYYNPYEIASYAQGPTQMNIAYTELGNIVKK